MGKTTRPGYNKKPCCKTGPKKYSKKRLKRFFKRKA